MGIRFECPNGHHLNVKAFLAGKRGICPECDTRFIVPAESGGHAEAVEEVAAAQTETAEPSVAAPPFPVTELSAPEAWYVRPVGGGQFGPADANTFRGWIAEGRVPHECLVWRTGWPDWKPGGEAIALLGNGLAVGVPTQVSQSESTIAIEVGQSRSAQTRRSDRRQRAKTITLALSALVFLLVVALALVLVR